MAKQEHVLTLIVPEDAKPERVDRWVSRMDSSFPRSAAADDATEFRINGRNVKKSKAVKPLDRIDVRWVEELFDTIEGQDIPLDVIYEDEHLLIIDKQQSLVVHPGAGNRDRTLVNGLVHRYGADFFTTEADEGEETDDEVEQNGTNPLRPGIVHRLDKDTSGVMVIAKNRIAHLGLAEQFKERTTEKYYIALVHGQMPKRRGHIETTIVRDAKNRKRFCVGHQGEGKFAHTDYLVLRQWRDMALVRLRLHTGRTHQIRVHLAHLGCPVVGDPIYGKRKEPSDVTLMLHALSLDIFHPFDGKRMRFRAPMPNRFKLLIRRQIDTRIT